MNPTGKKQPGLRMLAGSLLPSLQLLRNNDPLRLAGATAFFTTFALPPIVFILAQLFGLLSAPKMIGMGLIKNLSESLGEQGAEQIRQVIRSILGFSKSIYVIPGFIFLLFVATTLFSVIRSSLEQIWQIPSRKKSSIASTLGSRLKSFAVILLVGILFFAELFLRTIETLAGNYVQKTFGGSSFYFKLIFSETTSAIIISAWFIILFRFLTHSRPKWQACIAGGFVTGVLFIGGRVLLRTLLLKGNIGKLYGTSGSLVLVLLFVFYTSFILYFGACFVKAYSDKKGWSLQYPRITN